MAGLVRYHNFGGFFQSCVSCPKDRYYWNYQKFSPRNCSGSKMYNCDDVRCFSPPHFSQRYNVTSLFCAAISNHLWLKQKKERNLFFIQHFIITQPSLEFFLSRISNSTDNFYPIAPVVKYLKDTACMAAKKQPSWIPDKNIRG